MPPIGGGACVVQELLIIMMVDHHSDKLALKIVQIDSTMRSTMRL